LPTGVYRDVTLTPEAFMDTPTVNGQAYPSITVEPRTYRFRILNAANDRTQNLSLFQAVDAADTLCDAAITPTPAVALPMPGGAPLASCTEVRMVPAVPTANFPANWPTDGRAGGTPDPTTAGPDMVQIGSEGGLLPVPAIQKAQPVTYDLDKRSITILNMLNHGVLLGGAERADVLIDFSKYAGKTLILYNDAPTPMPAVDPRTDYYTGIGDMTDVGGAYDTLPGYGPNTRTIMQIKVAAADPAAPAAPLDTAQLAKDLAVAYAKTQPAPLVPQAVYNVPFGTHDVDNYAQIFTGGLTQPYFQMQNVPFAIKGATLISGGSGYAAPPAAPPAVTFTPSPLGAAKTASATAVVTNGVVTGFTGFNAGSGYNNTVPLTVTIAAPGNGGTTATAKVEVNAFKVINKAIQELFDPVYGRMNATLAVELPFTSQVNATTIPLAYIDTPVESLDAIKDGETQIWKITHNGVDSHPVHFHLMNVQLINRVDWAGVIKPPKPSEMGWKETITMNPLEDVYVAARAERPAVPFGLPTSKRMLDPSQAVNSTLAFTNLDPVTGQAPTFQRQLVGGVNGANIDVATTQYSNKLTDFDNEYVWHCHILGHEENDFMRPMIFHPDVVRPDAPTVTTAAGVTPVKWIDPTPFGGADGSGVLTASAGSTTVDAAGKITKVPASNNAKNEIGFKVLRNVATTVTTTVPGAAANAVTATAPRVIAMVPANVETWAGPAVLPAPTSTTDAMGVITETSYAFVPGDDVYQVLAYNAAGDSISGANAANLAPVAPVVQNGPTINVPGATGAPTGVTQTLSGGNTVLSWNAVAGATAYNVSGATCAMLTATSCTITGLSGATVSVAAVVNATAGAAASVFNGKAYSPVALTASDPQLATVPKVPKGTVTLTWANSPLNVGNNVTGLTLSWTAKGSTVVMGSQPLPVGNTGATVMGLASDKEFTFSVVANSTLGDSTAVKVTALSGK
jgi:FtsP/CotA-like multicopper oxidase with cupredoxin domain